MSRDKPDYLRDLRSLSEPISFKWGKKIAAKFYAEEVDERLYDAVNKCSFKASYAIAIAATEWIAYRFANFVDITDALNRIEAAWASAVELSRCRSLEFSLSDNSDDPKNTIGGPLEIALSNLDLLHDGYSDSDINLQTGVCRQLLLAKHVVPKAANFENWLSDRLRKLAKVFPQQAEPDAEEYDWWDEEPVPREFLESGFVYMKQSATAALQAFLATLDGAKNPYIKRPKKK